VDIRGRRQQAVGDVAGLATPKSVRAPFDVTSKLSDRMPIFRPAPVSVMPVSARYCETAVLTASASAAVVDPLASVCAALPTSSASELAVTEALIAALLIFRSATNQARYTAVNVCLRYCQSER